MSAVEEKAPFIRLLLPFAAGICLDEWFAPPLSAVLIPAVSAVLLFILSHYRKSLHIRFRQRYLFGIAVFFSFLAFGTLSARLSSSTPQIGPEQYTYIKAVITGNAIDKRNSTLLPATVTEWIDDSSTVRLPETVLLYFAKTDNTATLRTGDEIFLPNPLQAIRNSGNPEEFDYREYMRRKGYRYSGYVPAGYWRKTGVCHPKTLKQLSLEIRDDLLVRLRQIGFSNKNEALLSALLLGETGQITLEQKEEFSAAGLSHILAVSGLHVSILLTICLVLLYPLAYFRFRKTQSILLLFILWAYAFITGLPPTIVRACAMITILVFGRLIDRKKITLNSLFATAFLMLLYRPGYLFDVGFQLSFASVAAIVCILPYLEAAVNTRQAIGRFFLSTLLVTLSVQAGTWIITAFYFHNLPVFALFTNLIVLPFLPFIIGGSILLILTHSIGWNGLLIRDTIDFLMNRLHEITAFCLNHPFANLTGLQIEPAYLLFYFPALYLLLRFIQKRKTSHLIGLLACALLFIIWFHYLQPDNRTPIRSAILVYNRTETPFVQVVSPQNNLIIPIGPAPSVETVEYTTQNFNRKNRLTPPLFITGTAVSGRTVYRPPFIQHGETRLLILDSTRWARKSTETSPLPVDYAIVGPDFSGSFRQLTGLFRIDSVIITSEVSPLNRYRYKNECKKLRIGVHSVKEEGYWIKIAP